MNTCTHHLADGPLVCVREAHDDRGHIYVASAGPDLDGSTDGEY